MKVRFLTIAVVSILVMLGLNSIYGQTGTPIKFPAGKKSTIISGSLVKLNERKLYSIELKKGEMIYVKIASSNQYVGFDVLDPDGNIIGTPGDEDWYWEDEAAMGGTYMIAVHAIKGTGNYKMTVELNRSVKN